MILAKKLASKAKLQTALGLHSTVLTEPPVCNQCNNGLGRFFDSVDLLKAAINYLGSS